MRTDGRETGLTRVPVALLREAEQSFLDAVRVFDDLISRLVAKDEISTGEIYEIAHAFHEATTSFFNLRREIDVTKDADHDSDEEGEFNLEDARDRIRRLLDRLRPEGDSDALS